MPDDLEADLALARSMSEQAATLALPYFRSAVQCDWKADGSPVTEADLRVEEAMLEMLAVERPEDSVLSEETGAAQRDRRRRWLLDPIDGTVAFVAGEPSWGTHVALEIDGTIVVAVITRPAEGRAWWAAEGFGAWSSSGRRLRVSTTATPSSARIGGYVRPDSAWRANVARVAQWIDTPSPLLELIDGHLDAVLSESGFEWDHAPGVLLVAEAGGRFDDLAGGRRIDQRGGLYSNGHLHDWAAGMV